MLILFGSALMVRGVMVFFTTMSEHVLDLEEQQRALLRGILTVFAGAYLLGFSGLHGGEEHLRVAAEAVVAFAVTSGMILGFRWARPAMFSSFVGLTYHAEDQTRRPQGPQAAYVPPTRDPLRMPTPPKRAPLDLVTPPAGSSKRGRG